MAMYSQLGNKRQKIKESTKFPESHDFFPGVNKIEFKGEAAQYDDTFCYRYYNHNEKIHGHTMEEWIKPSISLTALRHNGIDHHIKLTQHNNWTDVNTLDDCKRFFNAAFELCMKLGIKYWTASNRDFPFNEEQNNYSDDFIDIVQDLQQKYSVKPMWISVDPMNFGSNLGENIYDVNAYMNAAQNIKKSLELAQKLGSEGFTLQCVDDGYMNSISTDVQKEIKLFSRLLKMTADFKERIGYRGSLLLNYSKIHISEESEIHKKDLNKMAEKNSYIYDFMSCYCFLKHHNLDRFYKIIAKPEYEYRISTVYNLLGSLEICRDDVISVKHASILMKSVVEQGGFQTGGINLKLFANSHANMKNILLMYIKRVDILAKGLRIATKILLDQMFTKNLQQRYITFYNGFGLRFLNGETTLEECEEQLRKTLKQTSDIPNSHLQEHWELSFQNYINNCKFN